MTAIRIKKHVDSETLVLSELRVFIGKDVEITVEEQPPSSPSEAELKARRRGQRYGALRGTFSIADDFDAPLPESVLRDFEGG